VKKILLLIAVITNILAYSQQVYFQEGFESESRRALWTQEILEGIADWDYTNGGVLPPNATKKIPAQAVNGKYNARFFKQSQTIHRTYLVSPPFSLALSQKPQLRFYYAQYPNEIPGGDKDNSKFTLCYRTPDYGNKWIELKDYFLATDGWIFDSLPLPDSVKYSNIQLGFLGISATVSYSSCIDSIMIVETDTIDKTVDKVFATHPNQDIVPTGSEDNPILKIHLPVKGNNGELFLKKLLVNAKLETELLVPANGVRIYITQTEHFTRNTPLGDTVSFVNGTATFSGLNYSLPFGDNYVWVTVDVAEDTQHKFKGWKLDAKIPKNGIQLNDKFYDNESELDPNGYREVNESIFYDDFENAINWDLVTEFEIDSAYGLGGAQQNPDPDYAPSGYKIMGTDLSGLNLEPGDYEQLVGNGNGDIYTATSPNFNCEYFKDLNLQFYRWLNISADDYVKIDYSTNNGVSWTKLWDNTTEGTKVLVAESNWKFIKYSLSSTLDRTYNVKFRFSLGPTGIAATYSGWNIDNFALTGNYVNNDVGISEFISPSGGSGLTASELVKVKIRNYGFDPSSNIIPVGYSTDNGYSWTMDTLKQVLAQDEEVLFTFTKPLNLSIPGKYRIIVSTMLSTDEDSRNNLKDTTIYSTKYATVPFADNFENNNSNGWRSGGTNPTWKLGTPAKTQIKSAYSGTKAWVTNLTGNYVNNDNAWLESPTFNFTNIDKPILECKLFTAGEVNKDGLAVYYTINEGSSWVLIPEHTGTYNWNWYNNKGTIAALGHEGWDIADNKWFMAREVLPAEVANQPKVRFRFVFKSDASGTNEGFAIDDVRVYNAPVDASIVAITDPVSDCILSDKQPITVRIRNLGIRPIYATDSLFTSVTINSETTLKDTFFVSSPLAIGLNTTFTFDETYNMFKKGSYAMTATVSARGDTSFYNTNNNTRTATATVLGEPEYSLGPDIGTLNPQSVTLDAGAGFTSYAWKNHYNDSTATGQLFNVYEFPTGVYETNYSVIATKSNGCISYDTIRVMKSVDDLGVIAATGLSNSCFYGNTGQNLQVTVQNYSTDTTYQVGNKIVVACELDNENIFYDTVTLTTTLGLNETFVHNFTKKIMYPEGKIYEVKTYPVLYGDLNFSNDTTYQTVSIYESANIDFGPDTIFTLRADTITLDVGENLTDIHWLGNATAGIRTYNIATNHTAKYYANAIDINGCFRDSDTIQIIGDSWELTSLTPNDMCLPSPMEQVTLSIKNKSNNSYTAGSKTIRAKVNFAGKIMEENVVIPALAAGASMNYTFSQTVNMSETKAYPVTASIIPSADMSITDNIITKDIHIWGTKEVNLGEDIISKRADTITLKPGAFYKTYQWQDGATSSTYKITNVGSAIYWVDVEDYNNCYSSRDSIKVFANDISVVNILSPTKSCDVQNLSLLKFTIENTGNDLIPGGENIIISYKIDNRPTEYINYVLPSDLEVGYKQNISVNKDFNFDKNLTHTFALSARSAFDFFPENDSAVSTVFQMNVPVVDLGDNIVYTTQADSMLLKAPAGYAAYRWQDGSRQETFDISYNGSYRYWVKVTNDENCTSSDTVTIIAGDVLLKNITGIKQDSCIGPKYLDSLYVEYPLTYEVQITGADTLRAGQSIKFYYSTNNGFIEYKNILLADNYYAGKNYVYTFSKKMDRRIGRYDFTGWIDVNNDFNTANNKYTTSFNIGPFNVGLIDSILSIQEFITLKANSGFSSYLWSTGAVSDSINVFYSGKYYIEAMPEFNCPSKDSTVVEFSGNRAKTELVNINLSECKDNISINPEFNFTNIGDSIWKAGQSVKYIYQLNNGSQYQESKTILSTVNQNGTMSHTLGQAISLATSGTKTIRIRVDINNQTVSDRTFAIAVSEPPVFSFSGDTVYTVSYPLVLDPGINNVTYLWNTGATTKTIEAYSDTTFTLTVTNASGCSYTQQVAVRFGIHVDETLDFNAKIYPNPTNSRLYISLSREFRNVNVQAVDISGRIVMVDQISNNGTMIINVSNWEPGVYLIRLYNEHTYSIHRIVVSE